MRRAARRAAFTPDSDSGMLAHLVGHVLAALVIEETGNVAGDDPEAIFARADYRLSRGELAAALTELDALSGLSARVVQDWATEARLHLLVEQAITALKAHVATLNDSLK
eukprot:PLAT7570.4.p3 GENE.PLAT7570.4~~PLAT7570.4.p3  ORF type:complete len:110 (+),score=53.55 PLAT7570.4:401-730(+)